ncbi:nuclear cap-binding protein subunit 1-like [Conger conger]|uniref:nuclear cap-binding protein subunit 1-like n=1 Tax=Conger conger TaxID=82655 RepID=UPI002A5AE5AF|nr:nuclear cap-binding protein subunit 1-like [Conger conger]
MKMTVRCDWYVYTVLSCLPWVGKELHEKKDVEMDRLLNQIEGYLKQRIQLQPAEDRRVPADSAPPGGQVLQPLLQRPGQVRAAPRNCPRATSPAQLPLPQLPDCPATLHNCPRATPPA